LFPNQPSRNDDDFHEKIVGELTFGLIHHIVEIMWQIILSHTTILMALDE
jgi:hypothetical protein